MTRLLGLDYGERRIGVSLSDPLRLIASPHSQFERIGYGPDIKTVSNLMQTLGADEVVLGLPRNMDGSLGFQAQNILGFGQKLEEAGICVHYWDERLTTVQAHRALSSSGLKHQDHKGLVDKTAAALILQSYLDAHPTP